MTDTVFALASTAQPEEFRYIGKAGTRLETAVSNLKSQARTGAMKGPLYDWIRGELLLGRDVVPVVLPYQTKLEAFNALSSHRLFNERRALDLGNRRSAMSVSRASEYRGRVSGADRPRGVDPDYTQLDRLTPGEDRVFEMFGQGLTVHDVAAELTIHPSSVYSITRSIGRKLGVPDHKSVAQSALFYFSLPT